MQSHLHVCACVCARSRAADVCVRACVSVRLCACVCVRARACMCENGRVRHLEALLGASAATAEATKLRTSGISAAASTTTTLPSEPGHLPASAAVRVPARRARMRSESLSGQNGGESIAATSRLTRHACSDGHSCGRLQTQPQTAEGGAPAGDSMASATRSSTVTFTAVLSVARTSAANALRCGGQTSTTGVLTGRWRTATQPHRGGRIGEALWFRQP